MAKLRWFWRAMERVPGLTAVPAVWRQALGEDWAWARPLLRETGALARRYPKLQPSPESPRAYRVVCHSATADDYVGVCPDETGTVRLRAAELALWTIDARALARMVAAAMGLVADDGGASGVPNAVRAGIANAMESNEEWVYLFTGANPGELTVTAQALAARHERRFVLLTATRSAWRVWPEPLQRRGRLAAMNATFDAAADGTLRMAGPTDRGPGLRRTVDRGTAGGDASAYVLSAHERLLLEILDDAPSLMKMADLEAATKEFGQRLSRRTIGPLLKNLESHGLTDHPRGIKSGVSITPAGQGLLRGGPAASQ